MATQDLKTLLAQKKRPILVELDPPRQTDPARFLQGALALRQAGADAITIADCPIGRASIDASMLAAKLKREYGIEALPHMACRDRNLNAAKALLMGLDMEGIHQALLITGDPVSHEDRGQIKGVFQMNSRTLAQAIGDLTRQGMLAPFFLCGALNINARNFDAELDKARRKEDCGMQAFLTQPVASERGLHNVRRARQALAGSILGGLFPIVSYKNACFLQREVNGVEIDGGIMQAYEGLNREEGEEMARRLCRDTARKMMDAVDGFYIMTPFQRVDLVKGIMADVRSIG
ncbi:MAG: methylenetetrahydrofolate reductase [Clostridia bacterium]|nr:methylenetetrahydrofolate reductase [Clostridia bacterium]